MMNMTVAKFKSYDDCEFEDIPEYGNLFDKETFIDYCKTTAFVDSDGFGEYVVNNKNSGIWVYPSDIMKKGFDERFTHVVWFNK